MLETIIGTLDTYLSTVCGIYPQGLATIVKKGDTSSPTIYVAKDDMKSLSLEDNISYHRVLSQTDISKDQGMTGCTDLMTKKYRMRYVSSFSKDILGINENSGYTADKIANTLVNILERSTLKALRNELKAADIECLVNSFSTNSSNVFSTEMVGHPFDNFPQNIALIAIDYEIDIIADTKCLLDFTCGESNPNTLLQIVLDESSCDAILNAIRNVTPPDKEDCIRKGISNGFQYTIDFDSGSRVVDFLISEYEGVIDTVNSINVFSAEYRVNDVVVTIPFQINIGDLLQTTITKGNVGVAQIILTASEFDLQSDLENVTEDALLNGRGVKTILDASMGVTLNYQLQTGNFDCNTGSKTITGGTIPPNVLNDEFETFITLHFTSGDFTTIIANVNSPTSLLLNDFPSDTENDVTFSISFVALIADQSGQGKDFIQTTPTLQPRYKYNIAGGYAYINFGNLTSGTSRYLQIGEVLIENNYSIYCVGYSLETFTTSGTNSMWGTFVSGGLIFGETTSGSIYGIELNIVNFGLAISAAKAIVPTSTIRGSYKLISNIISFQPVSGVNKTTTNLRINGSMILTGTGNASSSHITNFNIGARGFGISGGSWNMRAFAMYDLAHTQKEYQEIENYLTTKYSL